jgi:hypothetical protein
MKKIVFALAASVMVTAASSQVVTVPGTDYPFYSDIIKFQDSELNDLIEIVSVNKYINWDLIPIPLNEKLVQQNLLKSLNALRKQYGRKPLKLSNEISNNLKKSIETNSSIIVTWTTYGTFNEFNYVHQFKNKEAKFCDYLFDVMSITSELFFELINSNATNVGFYYKHNEQDSTYTFAVYIK